MNKKGFVLSTYVYMLLVFFLLLLTTMLAVLNNTKLLSNKLKEQSTNTSGLADKDYSFILLGEGDMILRKGDEYIEPGFKIQTSKKKDLSDIVSITGNVDVNNPNTYKLTYSATYNGITKKLTRNVHVLDNIASNYITGLYNYRKDENNLINPKVIYEEKEYDTGIRYTGSNPNNYVYFNCEDKDKNNVSYGEEGYLYKESCEEWRIIGVFDVDDGKGNIEKRVKLVRNEAIGQRVFDGDNSQVWKQSDLQLYLNAETEEGYYYSFSSNAKEQVNNAIWSTGLLKYNLKGTSPAEAYIQEKTIQNSESIVGLISVSDYGYSSAGNCIGIEFGTCAIDNWLKPEKRIWTIIPYFDYSYNIWYIDPGGGSNVNISSTIYLIQPSLYLKSNVTFIGNGNGTEESPYILGINE